MLRQQGFRLLGWSLPILILSSLASYNLPKVQPEEILRRKWGESVLIRGRLEMPRRAAEEIATLWTIEGPDPKPRAGILSIQVRTLDSTFDIKKRWNFAPKSGPRDTWSSSFPLNIPGSEVVAFRIRSEGAPEIPATATLSVLTDPPRSLDRLLKLASYFLLPSLFLCVITLGILIFSRLSRK